MHADRPNILLIYTDQHRWDCMGAHGHPLLQTPALDRLAAEGADFTNAFCPSPVCVPARASLLTGAWPTAHGVLANPHTEAYKPLSDDQPTFSRLLADSGYWLGFAGKWQIDPKRTPRDFGFHEYIPEAAYKQWRESAGLPPRPRDNGFWGQADPHIAPQQSRLAWGADNVIRLLEERAGRSQPFFIRWDTDEPHLPNVVPQPYASMYAPEKIAPWGSFGDRFGGKPYIQAQQLRTWKIDGWTWEQWAPIVGRYLGEISLIDAQVGRLIDAVDRLGIGRDTLIVYTTDHGDLCGSHGMIDKHFVMYEDVVRTALLMRWPGTIPAGCRREGFVCNAIDLARTFCELAGCRTPEALAGQHLLPLADGSGASRYPDIFATYHGNQFGLYSQRMVRDTRWKYVWNATAEDELYDLQDDPWELCNLASKPQGRGELARLRGRLVHWMAATKDPLLNSWIRRQLLEGLKV